MQAGKTIMILGTGSNVGKTIIAAGLCRLLAQDGYRVAPFKGWNLSLNSGVTSDGGEIGRGQLVQAEAAGISATVDMNPLLLKPEPGGGVQVIVRGKMISDKDKQRRLSVSAQKIVIRASLNKIQRRCQITVIEGSGSCAEPNRINDDVANLDIAKYAKSPVIIVGNIDAGGVFASLLGTIEIIKDKDPKGFRLVKGVIINGFRGDETVLTEAIAYFTEKTGLPVLGVIPYIDGLGIADEDSAGLWQRQVKKEQTVIDVVVPYVAGLQSLQNTDDFTFLSQIPVVQVRLVDSPESFGNPDLVLLGGSKGTVADLHLLERTGLAGKIKQHAAAGGAVIGICGGYQMLGEEICDPLKVESSETSVQGLGLLPVKTTFTAKKTIRKTEAIVFADTGLLRGVKGRIVAGYEIHTGKTVYSRSCQSLFQIRSRGEGAVSANGQIVGTYLHGLLQNDSLRNAIFQALARKKGMSIADTPSEPMEERYNLLADTLRKHLDRVLLQKILDQQT